MSKRIFLDPGHGNYDSGALGKNGTKEKDINLSVSLLIAKYLRIAGFEVGMSRDSDKISWPSNTNQDLFQRMQIANNFKPDAFISIHCNSATNVNAKGFELFTTPGRNNSDILATKIHSKVKSAFPNLIYREDWSDSDSDKEANFYVIRTSNAPATLIELLFISNLEEEKMLNDINFQDKMAFVIAQGIGDYFGIKVEKNEIPEIKLTINNKETTVPIRLVDGRIQTQVSGYWINVRDLSNMLGTELQWDSINKIANLVIK